APLVPLVMPATPVQPPSLAASVVAPVTSLASPSFGSGGFHVSVPVNVLHFGGSGVAAPDELAAITPIGRQSATAMSRPKTLRMQTPSGGAPLISNFAPRAAGGCTTPPARPPPTRRGPAVRRGPVHNAGYGALLLGDLRALEAHLGERHLRAP